ncbi:MAG: methyltransferase domain-containing protein [Candidatus Sulfobium sp.]
MRWQKIRKYPRTRLRLRRRVIADIDGFLADLRKDAGKGLHLGTGGSKLPGLINCDLYNPESDLKADATDLAMFDDGSIDLTESHHMIEHLLFRDTERALTEWYRVLRIGGLVIPTFPDISAISLKWMKYSLMFPLFPRPEKLEYMVKMFVGSQEHEGMYHKNAFDIRRMSRILSRYRFRVEFTYCPYPRRPTPSRLVIARKAGS